MTESNESTAVSDEQLIAAFRQSGDRQPLEELADRYFAKVRGMIYPMVLDHPLADDLTQEVFLRALRGLSGFDGRAQFSTWLFRVTMNTVYGFLARRKRSPVVFQSELPEPPKRQHAAADAQAIVKELDAAIAGALNALPAKLRAAIVLTTLQDLDVAEAARIEGCTRATMYWRIHEARKRLKHSLRDQQSP